MKKYECEKLLKLYWANYEESLKIYSNVYAFEFDRNNDITVENSQSLVKQTIIYTKLHNC